MSAVHDTTAAVQPTEAALERVPTNPTPTAVVPAAEEPVVPTTTEAVPATATTTNAVKPEETVAAPATTEEKAEEVVAPVTEAKVAEPITEGQLGYKAPGLLKQFIFSQKEFWLSDSAVTPQNLGLYLRGEKSEVSHPVTAWASQTGKGLLFFNKKGESDRTQPAGVIPLYEATDLKKASPHEFTFEISGHKHSFKASNDAERDGWYQSIEKSIELGKASKDSVRASETYKSEIEKLNAPNVIAAGAAKPSLPKKSTEVDSAEPKRVGSSDGDDEELKKKNNTKSRSTSRGVLNRLKGKKEEHDVKKEEKKDEKEAVKEEKAVEKDLSKTDETTPVVAAAPVAATTETPVVESSATAEPVAPVEEKPIEALPVAADTTATPEEKAAKPSKRGSIFGRIPSAWGSLKSPSKEKGEKEAELKPEVPAKDATVSEAAPQLPETATTEPIETPVVAPVTEATKPEIAEPVAEPTKATEATPSKEKKNFLSGLPFLNKRDRSVSPSAAAKEQPKIETSAPVVPAKDLPAKDEVAATEPVKVEEPVAETTPAVVPATNESAIADEPKTAEATSPNGNKRQSMLGNLGRRASKALNRIQPKKENATPVAADSKTPVAEETTAPAVTEKKADETTPVVSDPETTAARAVGAPVVPATEEENKPEAVGVNPSTQVTASA
jgi:hypothetical protein